MKIAIINVTWYYGSTGQLAYNLYREAVGHGHEVRLFYGRDDEETDNPDIIRLEGKLSVYAHAAMARITGLEGYYSQAATQKLIRELDRFQPDLLVLSNLVGYYINQPKLFQHINEKQYRTVYCMIDEYSYCGKCCYPGSCDKWKNNCEHCKDLSGYPKSLIFDTSGRKQRDKLASYGDNPWYIFAGPEYVCKRASESTILRSANFAIVDECIDVDLFKPRDTAQLRENLQIPKENKIVLNVCPVSNKRKGAAYYFDAIRKVREQGISFIQVGCDTDQADYPENLIRIGYVYDQETLAGYLSLADTVVCSSVDDTMPNVCLEALSCGTPIIGFRAGGIPYVANDHCGTFLTPGNAEELADAMSNVLKKDADMIQTCRSYALSRYSFSIYYEKLIEAYERLNAIMDGEDKHE